MFESDDFDQVLSQYDFPEITNNSASKENNSRPPQVPEKRSPELNNLTIRSPEHNNLTISPPELNNLTRSPPELKNHSIRPPEPTNLTIRPPELNNVMMRPPEPSISRSLSPIKSIDLPTINLLSNVTQSDVFKSPEMVSPKHLKRKMINSFFDTKCKRKFPGPAGLLTGSLAEFTNENICHIELLSQDIDFSENHLKDVFESPIWDRLQRDTTRWDLGNVDSIETIKQQALATGHLRRRKAQVVTAFVEAVDRTEFDPLVILRDASGNIKGALHREAWLAFSSYIASDYCALILWKPTVLTPGKGSKFKKHYLNIMLSNIYAIYSSVVKNEEDEILPEGYQIVCSEGFTVIKTENLPRISLGGEESVDDSSRAGNDMLLDGLDSSMFLEDLF